MSLKYIVTGATGFVGNNTVRKLLENNLEVLCFVKNKQKADLALKGLNVKIFLGDVRSLEDLEKMISIEDEYILIHTAAIVSIGDKKKDKLMDQINCQAVEAIISLCKKHNNIKKLIHVSSVHAIPEGKKKSLIKEVDYFDPKLVVGKYAKSKAESTALVVNAIKEGLNAYVIHPAGIIGPNDYSNTHLTQMIVDYANNKIPAALKGGYDFVDVRDVANLIYLLTKYEGDIRFFLASNKYYSVKELLQTVTTSINRKKNLKALPMFLAYIAIPFLGIYAKIKGTTPLYTSYSLYTLKSNSNFTHERATKELGYTPRTLEETINDTVSFLKEQKLI